MMLCPGASATIASRDGPVLTHDPFECRPHVLEIPSGERNASMHALTILPQKCRLVALQHLVCRSSGIRGRNLRQLKQRFIQTIERSIGLGLLQGPLGPLPQASLLDLLLDLLRQHRDTVIRLRIVQRDEWQLLTFGKYAGKVKLRGQDGIGLRTAGPSPPSLPRP